MTLTVTMNSSIDVAYPLGNYNLNTLIYWIKGLPYLLYNGFLFILLQISSFFLVKICLDPLSFIFRYNDP